MTEKKLYRVDVEWAFYALAENEEEALDCARLAQRDNEATDCCWAREVEYANESLAEGWDRECLVYGGRNDVRLRDALSILPTKGKP